MKSLQISLSFLALLYASVSSAATFKGTISLPNGMTAGAKGVTFDIGTQLIEFYFNGRYFELSSTTVKIPPFANSVAYSFGLPPNPSYDEHTITFDCVQGCASIDATTTGFWSSSRGVVGSFLGATEYDSSVTQTINIDLEPADTFSGKIALPEGFVATGAELFFIRLRNTARFSFTSYSSAVKPLRGQTSVDFHIGVPSTGTPEDWKLEFDCYTCDEEIEAEDHYPTRSKGNPPTLVEQEQFEFARNQDYRNMRLTFISNRPRPINPAGKLVTPIVTILLGDD